MPQQFKVVTIQHYFLVDKIHYQPYKGLFQSLIVSKYCHFKCQGSFLMKTYLLIDQQMATIECINFPFYQ